MSNKFEEFKKLLREMFQIEQAKELDFGIYRIMNYRREEIEKFLEQDLLPQVREVLSEYVQGDHSSVKVKMRELELKAKEVGFESIDELPQGNKIRTEYEELKERLAVSVDIHQAEIEVYSALLNFFKRYYDKGDFISQRRYKEGVYAIPYEGEEVKLYWANHDQYYIKTTENFRDYSFKIYGDKIVHFRLVDAKTEKDNNKEQPGKERRFLLCKEDFLAIENGELVIRFEYRIDPDKQDKHTQEAFERITRSISTDPAYAEFLPGLLTKAPTEKNQNRTILEKHLTHYTAKNTFDYFIHKDLERFLKRELDFYIKTEIMRLDDLDTANEAKVNTYLAKIKAIKRIGHKIIDFLAQIENFQKKLWLKKKFVVETNYCITLDRIPEEFYPEIAANEAQREEWVRLFAIDEIEGDLTTPGYTVPLTVEFLKANPYLVLDTKFFSNEFKERLIAVVDGLDEKTDGLLINSENFQALNLLSEKYKEKIKCIYIDPPYNTKTSEILYKNNFKHSSWLSMMFDRLFLGKKLLNRDGINIIAIDEVEQELLGQIINQIFPGYRKVCISIVHNPRGQQGKNVSYVHEFAYFIYPSDDKKYIADVKRDEIDSRNLRDSGTESGRADAKTCFYPFLVREGKIIGVGEVPSDDFHPPSANVYRDDGTIEVWPIDDSGNEKKWRYSVNSVSKILDKLEIKKGRSALQVIFNKDTGVMRSTWVDSKYDASEYGTKVLQSIFGAEANSLFSYPKSINTVKDSLISAIDNLNNVIVLDFFAGSGTTGHAVIELNRNDKEKGRRKYILVEMGRYFDTVLVPRIQKVIYSIDWKNGKPVDRNGISHMFKYMKLESYDDTLNNIEMKRTNNQQMALNLSESLKEQYYLYYMLDQETAGSSSLLNIDMVRNPFAYKMKIAEGVETKIVNIDLVETFNYLIGLDVKHMGAREYFRSEPDPKGEYEGAVKLMPDGEGTFIFKSVEGTLRSGERVLIIWRTLTGDIEVDNAALDAYLKKKRINPQDFEYDLIYVNGDNNLQNMKRDEEHWKVVLIEEEFKKRMFDVRDI